MSLDNARLLASVALSAANAAGFLVISLLAVVTFTGLPELFLFITFISLSVFSWLNITSIKNKMDLRRSIYFHYEHHKETLEQDGYYIKDDGSVERIQNDDRKNQSKETWN
jgi:hypothetical protein